MPTNLRTSGRYKNYPSDPQNCNHPPSEDEVVYEDDDLIVTQCQNCGYMTDVGDA